MNAWKPLTHHSMSNTYRSKVHFFVPDIMKILDARYLKKYIQTWKVPPIYKLRITLVKVVNLEEYVSLLRKCKEKKINSFIDHYTILYYNLILINKHFLKKNLLCSMQEFKKLTNNSILAKHFTTYFFPKKISNFKDPT